MPYVQGHAFSTSGIIISLFQDSFFWQRFWFICQHFGAVRVINNKL